MSPQRRGSIKTQPQRNLAFKIIGLVIVGFALIGLVFTSVFSRGSNTSNEIVFGSYGNKDIVYTYNNSFGNAVGHSLSNYSDLSQDNQIYSFVRRLAWREAYHSAVYLTAIEYYLDQSGYQPSSRAVDRRIIEHSRYQTDGKFDERRYRSVSSEVKDNDRELARDQLSMSIWAGDILDSQYHSKAQLNFLWDMATQENSYDYVIIPFSDFPEQEVIKYGQENSYLFTTLPLSRITVESEEEAKRLIDRYGEKEKTPESFALLAREISQDSYAEEGGSIGETDFYLIDELIGRENAESVYKLEEGEIAGPFESEYGWIIFRADGSVSPLSLTGRGQDIRTYMMENELGIVEDAILEKASELRANANNANSFLSTMLEEGFEVKKSHSFPINYAADSLLGGSPEDSDDAALNGTASSDEFWKSIVGLTKVGAISQPVVLNNAVGIFALTSLNSKEKDDFWEERVKSEIARSRQNEFSTAILDESKLFDDRFSSAYKQIFPEQ
ncbi:hypothetical protein S1OALGB6SA_2088 [Olavius algarvensis spirochete endosymbiont]|nr:MAG: hypothetical protein [Olavius algarvensis spirochete endosymbiont]VDB00994.1 hypothetical protein S1OALGB6SA_2088 [Olavius algarvensis spirochete endosymbiont]